MLFGQIGSGIQYYVLYRPRPILVGDAVGVRGVGDAGDVRGVDDAGDAGDV